MTAEIVVVGTELLLGDSLDTNSQWLCRRFAELGVDVFQRTTVGDNLRRCEEAIRQASLRADLVLISGGLGPTVDDVTRQAAAAATGRSLVLDETLLAALKARFASRGVAMTDNNTVQAMVPRGASALENPVGSAPGLWIEHGDRIVAALPGVPRELMAMFDTVVVPRLRPRLAGASPLFARVLHVAGLPESHVDAKIADLFRSLSNPTIGMLAHAGRVDVRLTAKAATEAEAHTLIAPVERSLLDRIGDHVYGFDGDTLEAVIGQNLAARGATLSVAESLTGGRITDRLTDVPGASHWFERAVVAYANAAKIECLGVDPGLLERDGAVSEACARAMAEGVRAASRTTYGLAVTGIAGPTGGTSEKPVGRVHLAFAGKRETVHEQRDFPGDRESIKRWTTGAALTLVWKSLVAGS